MIDVVTRMKLLGIILDAWRCYSDFRREHEHLHVCIRAGIALGRAPHMCSSSYLH